MAHFYEGVCGVIMFRKADGGDEKAKEISDGERDVLLKANGGGREWRRLDMVGEDIIFATEDGEISAQYNVSTHYLAIYTSEGRKRREEAKKSVQENKLKGF
jgi:hypothetical protein